ncbi:hypothetical protein SAMN04487895_101477 [Paenibacillus sophorae]|uniref:Uncharacterized protein n=1 Tax=Paenibacillus sophorae TaxID=1333845 RepID=A0A1H8GEA9_9BACL|nr:hypothetical protein [Paenibacillus sophorae]QWU18566.1 hypothetical protein KP014_19940 [Paenibacillus sophorae]SEN42120.1 hypothetical protein SAMN04487895_101477 [Paenibacillus sophorae]
MYGKMHSACLYGIEGVMIGVEVDLANGLPQTNVWGYIVRKIDIIKPSKDQYFYQFLDGFIIISKVFIVIENHA